jgi:hypothetical protein
LPVVQLCLANASGALILIKGNQTRCREVDTAQAPAGPPGAISTRSREIGEKAIGDGVAG